MIPSPIHGISDQLSELGPFRFLGDQPRRCYEKIAYYGMGLAVKGRTIRKRLLLLSPSLARPRGPINVRLDRGAQDDFLFDQPCNRLSDPIPEREVLAILLGLERRRSGVSVVPLRAEPMLC